MDCDGEIQQAFKRIAEAKTQLEEKGEFERLAELHRALGIMGATVLGSMVRAKYSSITRN